MIGKKGSKIIKDMLVGLFVTVLGGLLLFWIQREMMAKKQPVVKKEHIDSGKILTTIAPAKPQEARMVKLTIQANSDDEIFVDGKSIPNNATFSEAAVWAGITHIVKIGACSEVKITPYHDATIKHCLD